MVLIKVNTYRHYFNDRVAVKTINQEDTDTNIKNILPSDVIGNLDKFNISLSLSYPRRADIVISPTKDSLENDNITKLFSGDVITSKHELKIRIRMNSYPTPPASGGRPRAAAAPTPNQLQDPSLPRGRVIMGDEDDEAYGGGLRSSKRRKSKKRKSKRRKSKKKMKRTKKYKR